MSITNQGAFYNKTSTMHLKAKKKKYKNLKSIEKTRMTSMLRVLF